MAILNNIKNVLSEKGVMSKWLAKQLQKDPATVSKWCNNHYSILYRGHFHQVFLLHHQETLISI